MPGEPVVSEPTGRAAGQGAPRTPGKAAIPISGPQAAIDLAECKGQQARTQEREADRRQDQESVGDSVVVTHDTPTTSMLVRIY